MTILIILVVAIVAASGAALVMKNLTEICQPNEVLVFSGAVKNSGRYRRPYRIIHGGRAMRIPLLERIDRLDLTNMVIDLSVKGAYSRGGIPLNVEGVANVKIASNEPTIGNAIERFLGVERDRIVWVARESLEGSLRGVLATLTPEEVNQDRVKFAESLLTEADTDLKKLGLELDTLKIQNVSDEVGYLDSIGRQQSALLYKRSAIAEVKNQSLARIRNAQNLQDSEKARIRAEMDIAKVEAERRIIDAETKQTALVQETETRIAADVAKAKAELEAERARLERVRHELVANIIRPAEAEQRALIEKAKGEAAQIMEDGRANAEAIQALAVTWAQLGPQARDIVVGQKLPKLVHDLMQAAHGVQIGSLTMVDSQVAGSELAGVTSSLSSQLKNTIGSDLKAMVHSLTNSVATSS